MSHGLKLWNANGTQKLSIDDSLVHWVSSETRYFPNGIGLSEVITFYPPVGSKYNTLYYQFYSTSPSWRFYGGEASNSNYHQINLYGELSVVFSQYTADIRYIYFTFLST